MLFSLLLKPERGSMLTSRCSSRMPTQLCKELLLLDTIKYECLLQYMPKRDSFIKIQFIKYVKNKWISIQGIKCHKHANKSTSCQPRGIE
jgi:hypothetical protein